jgi:hypothetical protein
MKIILAVFLVMIGLCNALDVTVGLTACPTCVNYYQLSETDAQPKLQELAGTLKAAGGGKITFLPGTYILGKYWEISSNIVVIGAGMDVTTLKLKDFALPWKTATSSRSGFIRATVQNNPHCKDISIIGLTLDGNKANQNTDTNSKYGRYGLFTEGCTNVLFDSVRIKNWQGYGFDPHGWKSGNVYGKFLTIKNCIANDNDWDGFTLDQTDTIVVDNCVSINNGRHGFNIVTGSFNVILTNVKTEHNGYYYYTGATGCGIMAQNNQLFGTHGVTVQGAVLNNDRKAGVCVNDVYSVVTDQIQVTTTPDKCYYLTDTRDVTISNVYCNALAKKFITYSGINTNTLTSNVQLAWTTTG